MEETSEESLMSLNVDYDAGNLLKDTAKWTKFISIVLMICIALFLIVMIFAATALSALYSSLIPGFEKMAGGLIVSVVILVLAVFGIMFFLLYRFSVLIKKGIDTQEQETFNKGLNALKIYFILSGIVGILSLLASFKTLIKQLIS